MAVLLTNLGTDLINNDVRNQLSVIKRFNKLPFKNKLIFSSLDYKMDNVVVLKGYFKVRDKKIYGQPRIYLVNDILINLIMFHFLIH